MINNGSFPQKLGGFSNESTNFTDMDSGNNKNSDGTNIGLWCDDLQVNDLMYSATHHDSPLRQIVSFIFLVLLVFTVFGNTFVILVVIIDRRLRRITSGLIVSMALADLLVGLSLELHGVIMLLDQSGNHLSSTMCELSISIDIYFGLCELLHLVCLSVERYLAICHPFLYERCGKKFLTLIIIVAWTVPLLFSFIPIMTLWHEVRQDDLYRCLESLHVDRCVFFPNKIYSSVLFVVMFFIPTALLIFCYTKILQVAMTQRRRIDTQTTLGSYESQHEAINDQKQQNFASKEYPSTDDNSLYLNTINFEAKKCCPEPEESPFLENGDDNKSNQNTSSSANIQNDSDNHKMNQVKMIENVKELPDVKLVLSGVAAFTNRTNCHHICRAIFGIDDFFRASRSIIYVCISYVLTWTPYWTVIMISPFVGPQNVPKAAIITALWMFAFGTAVNPFVYYFCNTDVRRGICRILKKLCFKYVRCEEPEF